MSSSEEERKVYQLCKNEEALGDIGIHVCSVPLYPIALPSGETAVVVDKMYLDENALEDLFKDHPRARIGNEYSIIIYADWRWSDDNVSDRSASFDVEGYNTVSFSVGNKRCGGAEYLNVVVDENDNIVLDDTCYYVS